MDAASLSLGAALLLGLVFGAGSCSVVCLPLLGPAMVGRGGGRGANWLLVLSFSLGRLSGYAGIAALAGWLGHAAAIEYPWVMQLFTGFGSVFIGLLILARASRRGGGCRTPSARGRAIPLEALAGRPAWSASGGFAMGLGMAFSPCAPLGTVVLAAAALGSMTGGAMLGLAFGIGATLIPALLFGLGVSALAWRLRLNLAAHRIILERFAGTFLLALGTAILAGWIRL